VVIFYTEMKEKKQYFPSLDDIAFEGRNKEYGAYYLRRRYPRYLSISGAIAIFVFLVLLSVPIVTDLFEKVPRYDEMMPVIEFYSLNPPSEDDLSALIKAFQPAPEVEEIPKVVDTVKPEKEKIKEEVKSEEEVKKENADSLAGSGGGQAKEGTGAGEDTGIYTTLDVYPRFPGGDRARFYFLRSNIHYPDAAVKAGIGGVVMVVFVIEPDGSLSNIEVSKGIGSGCDEEAVRVVKIMPRWEPGRRSGRAVRVLVRMPIVFKIPGKP
jgi:periplasmic protein TonB